MAISVFSGEVNRTWLFLDPESSIEHIVTLYHDTISGVRCAMLDYEEIPGSMGTTLIFSQSGATIIFTINNKTGFIRISREGLISFKYECVFNGTEIPESTSHVSSGNEERYSVSVKQTVTTKNDSFQIIAWYEIESIRPSDGAKTVVHRRFRDFSNLDAEIRAALKGNHLSSSLPILPGKAIKVLHDHKTPEFIEQRRIDLDVYLQKLFNMPHVPQMYQLQSFLGIVKTVREYSVVFRNLDTGISLERVQAESPACVALVRDTTLRDQISVGDLVSKINGKPVARVTFEELMHKIETPERPLIVCFIKRIDRSQSLPDDRITEDEVKTSVESV